jgi:diadenosine tetraphosphate (Ap4A) HIT family hydrolase
MYCVAVRDESHSHAGLGLAFIARQIAQNVEHLMAQQIHHAGLHVVVRYINEEDEGGCFRECVVL